MGEFACVAELLFGNGFAEKNVLADGACEERRFLIENSEVGTVRHEIIVVNVASVKRDFALKIIEALQQQHQS